MLTLETQILRPCQQYNNYINKYIYIESDIYYRIIIIIYLYLYISGSILRKTAHTLFKINLAYSQLVKCKIEIVYVSRLKILGLV